MFFDTDLPLCVPPLSHTSPHAPAVAQCCWYLAHTHILSTVTQQYIYNWWVMYWSLEKLLLLDPVFTICSLYIQGFVVTQYLSQPLSSLPLVPPFLLFSLSLQFLLSVSASLVIHPLSGLGKKIFPLYSPHKKKVEMHNFTSLSAVWIWQGSCAKLQYRSKLPDSPPRWVAWKVGRRLSRGGPLLGTVGCGLGPSHSVGSQDVFQMAPAASHLWRVCLAGIQWQNIKHDSNNILVSVYWDCTPLSNTKTMNHWLFFLCTVIPK